MENLNILEVIGITKKFGQKIANHNISFSIKKGERIGIIGANGAGKTTLVEQIIGTIKPSSGEIKYNFKYKTTPQEKMGMQFQESSYPTGLRVKDIINFSLEIYGSDINGKDLSKMLEKFQVKAFYKSNANGLSGGQKQKLNVLLAIAHNPEIVILDEISTGLDISAREEILGYVDDVTKEKEIATILVSHNMDEIERLCSRVIILAKGEVLMEETIKNIQEKHHSLSDLMRKIIKEDL